MTDEQISEVYSLARDSFLGGQPSFQVQAYPFRMTPVNLARHRTNPHMAFWEMLKIGNDHFRGDASRAQGGGVRSSLRIRCAASVEVVETPVVRPGG
jgi:hypothetical protein